MKLQVQAHGFALLLSTLVLLLLLLHPTTAFTADELGTVSYVNGVPCRFCFLDCSESPLLQNCQTRYYEYGCHINQYCITVNTATAREFFTGIAMCIIHNGCELVTADERMLLNATSEGRLDLQVKDFVTTQTSLSANTNMFKLQSEVFTMYHTQITSIENTWTSNANKLTEGKRKAFQLINISPAFFLLQDLMQNMFRDAANWKYICDEIADTGAVHGTAQFFAPLDSEVRTDSLLNNCVYYRNILSDVFNFNETEFLRDNNKELDKCRERAMYLNVYRHLCLLPRDFLITARIADQIIGDDYGLLTRKLYTDFTSPAVYSVPIVVNNQLTVKKVYASNPAMQEIFISLQSFAFNYVAIMESNMNATAKQNGIAAITDELKSKAALCDGLYCTYLCKDYAYDIASKYCDVFDESVDFIRSIFTSYCSIPNPNPSSPAVEFHNTADMFPVDFRAASTPALKYCKASQRSIGRTTKELCTLIAMQTAGNKYAPKPNGPLSPTRVPMPYFSNGASFMQEQLTAELDYFFGKYSACTNTICSRQAGCDIQINDVNAVTQYFDYKTNWMLTRFNQLSDTWKKIMNTLPRIVFTEGGNGQLWVTYMNAYTSAWSAVTTLGENLKAPPAAAALSGGRAIVVAWTSNDEAKYRLYSDGMWYEWIGLGGVVTQRPAVIALGGTIFVFVVRNDKKLYYRRYDGASWTPYTSLDISCTGAPSVVAWGSSKIFVSVKAADNTMTYRVYNSGTDSFEPTTIIPGAMAPGTPSTVMLGDGRLVTVVRSPGNVLMYNINQNQEWLPNWAPLTGKTLASNPFAVVFGALNHKVMAFAKCTDNYIWYRLFEDNVWGVWTSLAGGLTVGSAPTAFALDPFRVALFVRGSGGAMRYRIYSNGQWSVWNTETLGGSITAEQAAITLMN